MNEYENRLGITEDEMVDKIVHIANCNPGGIVSLDYIRPIAEYIVHDVMEDICASSDNENYNDDDIRLSVGRAIYDKLYVFKNSGFEK